jgi:DNA polymerase-1
MPEKRVQLQPTYKQQREAMPTLMVSQLDFIRDLCGPMGFVSIARPNTEADDLMACYVLAANGLGMETVLATNDKDLFQLVSESVRVYSTSKVDLKHPKDSHALLGVEEVVQKWGVPPIGIPEVLALTGDSVDNIPGIDGIGTKTAANLVREFGTIASLLESLDKVSNLKLREKLEQNRERILQNREMVRLELDHELPLPLDRLKLEPRYPEFIRALEHCEFKSLLDEVKEEAAQAGTGAQGTFW